VGKAVWDDDKCLMVWKNMVTDVPYKWKVTENAQSKLIEILGADLGGSESFFEDDLESSILFRAKLGAVLKDSDRAKAREVAAWIVVDWGKIRSGASTVPSWMDSLRDFDGHYLLSFVEEMGTNRISSWSKILAFAVQDKYAVYDSRTAVALNSAMVIADIRPHFFMPLSQSANRNTAIREIKQRSADFSGGFDEYNFVLSRFVELGFAASIFDAERRIFMGADKTVEVMMRSI
jgi:hypothetical protein